MITIRFTGTELVAFDRHIPATCIVRSELNGWRKPEQIVRTLGQTYPHGLAYQPRQFPPGSHEITRVEDMGDETAYWPVYIDTDARQELKEWGVSDGKYTAPTGTVFLGRGYGIHHARYQRSDEMVASNTTLGCINVLAADDARWLGDEIRKAMGMRQKVYFDVPAWDEWEA